MDQKRLPPSRHQLEAAFFAGLQTGGDPEALEEMGYPTTPESFEAQVAAGREVATVLSRNGTAVSPGTVKKLGVYCADCPEFIPSGESCGHISVNKKGTVR